MSRQRKARPWTSIIPVAAPQMLVFRRDLFFLLCLSIHFPGNLTYGLNFHSLRRSPMQASLCPLQALSACCPGTQQHNSSSGRIQVFPASLGAPSPSPEPRSHPSPLSLFPASSGQWSPVSSSFCPFFSSLLPL